MQDNHRKRVLLHCLVCGDFNPYLLNARACKYFFSIRPGNHIELISYFSRRFSHLKYLRSLDGDLVHRPFADLPKWFNYCLKTINVLTISDERYFKSKFFISKMHKAPIKKLTMSYNTQTSKLLKGSVREVKDLVMTLKETILANSGHHIIALAKIFNRSPSLRNCTLNTEGFQALSLEYLRMAIAKTKTSIHFQIFFDLNKMR